MNVTLDRDMIAQLLIILGLCLGGWIMFIKPNVDELAELEATIDQVLSSPLGSNSEAIQRLANQHAGVRERIIRVQGQSDLALDSSAMYGMVMQLAREHRVTVERLIPGADRGGVEPEQSVRATTFGVTVSGAYAHVAGFLEAVDGIEGFIRPVSLDLEARGDSDTASLLARATYEAISFTLPEALTSMTEGSNGVP